MSMRSLSGVAVAGVIMIVAGGAFARGPVGETNLEEALEKARTQNKLLFVQYGREACGNCQALKAMIQQRQVRLSDSEFVYADINCDDPATRQVFGARFKVEGNTLPFVVIADPDGKQLAGRSGYGSAVQFTDFIRDVKRVYNKDEKDAPAPRKPLVLPKPRASGIAPDENRDFRAWTAGSGAQVMAALVEERAGMVVLKKEDGARLKIRESSLSKEDQDYLARLRETEAETTAE